MAELGRSVSILYNTHLTNAKLLGGRAANVYNRPMWTQRNKHTASPHLSHHAVPRSVDLLAMFPVRDQVKVVGELDRLGDLLQDVDAETFTAALYVDPRFLRLIAVQVRESGVILSNYVNRCECLRVSRVAVSDPHS